MKEAAKQEMRFIAFGVTFGESGVRVIAPSLSLPHSLSPFKQQDSRGVTLRTAPALFLANEGRERGKGKGGDRSSRVAEQQVRFGAEVG